MIRHTRHHPAHLSLHQPANRSTIVFVTVCTKDRIPVLANSLAHERIISAWRRAELWLAGKYVMMPDHLHVFASPNTFPPHPVAKWVGYWKSIVSCSWHEPADRPLWQENFWDTQLRSTDSYSAKWAYVRENPLRAKLCTSPEDWPYQGELNPLDWHD